jgi:Tfp pilus assembly protein PilE
MKKIKEQNGQVLFELMILSFVVGVLYLVLAPQFRMYQFKYNCNQANKNEINFCRQLSIEHGYSKSYSKKLKCSRCKDNE